MATTFEAGTASAMAVVKAVRLTTPAERNPDLDIVFDCLSYDQTGAYRQGVPSAYATASGSIPFVDFETTATARANISASLVTSLVVSEAVVTAAAKASATLILQGGDLSNWVKWSDIGNLDFEIGLDNIAGEMPMDWKGMTHAIRKLSTRIVVMGDGGVSFLNPVENKFGLKTIHHTGLYSRDASAGDDTVHYFVDKTANLFEIGFSQKTLDHRKKKLGYSEFLSNLTDPVLTLDVENQLLYLCDGTIGYVYSIEDGSMGSGPANITGIGYQNGVAYTTASGQIDIPVFEICTDIYDYGTRKNKTIYQLEFGTNLGGTLQASVDYRRDITGTFVTTPWKNVHEKGTVKIVARGGEFRLRARLSTYEYFELDYIRVRGITHIH